MRIEVEQEKNLKVGDIVEVTCDNPLSREPNFGKRSRPYPGKGWRGKLLQSHKSSYNCGIQWVIRWDDRTRDRKDQGQGDLVWDWMIDKPEWDLDEN